MKNSFRWSIAQKAEFWWWKNYLKARPVRDYLEWKKSYWKKILKRNSEHYYPGANDRVLDAGCGPAGVFTVLQNCKVDAFDPLILKYSDSLAHFSTLDYPNVRFVNSSMEEFKVELPYKAVYCMNAINHVLDIHAAFDKIASAVETEGWLFITIDAHNYAFFKYLFRLIPGDILHPHQYDNDEYESMLKERGFSIISNQLIKANFFFNHYLIAAKKK